jgi:hypothetical protein
MTVIGAKRQTPVVTLAKAGVHRFPPELAPMHRGGNDELRRALTAES